MHWHQQEYKSFGQRVPCRPGTEDPGNFEGSSALVSGLNNPIPCFYNKVLLAKSHEHLFNKVTVATLDKSWDASQETL